MIPITKPFMPPIQEYEDYLKGIWEREYLTNDGPLVKQFEKKMRSYLGVENILYVANGTVALQLAIKALELKGEIITTPFSFVATSSSIVWEGCEPVFVDIDPVSLNINPDFIEQAITEKTSAILATHVFGNPCDVEAIDDIAKKNGLKVIYDAAYCFGVKYKGQSIFNWGDISITSFHATKLFHTVEGGGVFCKDEVIYRRIRYMRNFGQNGPENFAYLGINGKNSEFHAAMGLTLMKYIPEILRLRKEQWKYYYLNLPSIGVRKLKFRKYVSPNYSYFPIIFESEEAALEAKKLLMERGISTRRYFYPSLNKLSYVSGQNIRLSESISSSILCLPLYHTMSQDMQCIIQQTIESILNNRYINYAI